MQYSLLYSSSIVQHFSFYEIKLFQLEKKLHFLKVFLSKNNGRNFKVIKVTLTKFIFEPYLITIRCSLRLYVIQLEVP